jgi:hypothetical protein
MKDRSGNIINLGSDVEMPLPNDSDYHNCEFVGRVHVILEDKGTIVVVDQEDTYFEVEGDRVEVVLV